MNMNGFARGYMAKNKTPEEFLMHVADVVERQNERMGQIL
jgi:hypothetical protein